MMALRSSFSASRTVSSWSSRKCGTVPPFPSVKPSQVQPQQMGSHKMRSVQMNFFKFGKNGVGAEDAGIVGSQGRDEYNVDDVEQYFNYMGFLAEEGTYDRMEALIKTGLHPIDIILLLACSENDTPKVGEILAAGADLGVKGLDGKTPMEIASKPELIAILKEYESKAKARV